MKGITIMYGYKFKIAGVIVSAFGLIGMTMEKVKKYLFINNFNINQHYHLFKWIMLVGLLTIIFSKEKNEDDRANHIRLKSFQISFAILQATLLSFILTVLIINNRDMVETSSLFLFSALGIILYLLFFHFGLYFDFIWEYDYKTVKDNIKYISKSRWGLIAYLVISAITLIILIII